MGAIELNLVFADGALLQFLHENGILAQVMSASYDFFVLVTTLLSWLRDLLEDRKLENGLVINIKHWDGIIEDNNVRLF